MNTESINQDLPNGPVAAVLLAGGLGSAALGLATTLGEASKAVGDALNWWKPAGPLTGKVGIGVGAFFLAWLVLHGLFRGRNVKFARVAAFALLLLGLGMLGTFPPFFELFVSH